MPRIQTAFAAVALSMLAAAAAGAEAPEDFNSRYRYPFSMGAAYYALKPLGADLAGYDAFGVSGAFRMPLSARPALQPSFRFGFTSVTAPETESAWSHTDYFGLAGAAWSQRFSKSFEAGAELGAGASLSVFPKLAADQENLAALNLMVQLGAQVALSPSFNFALELNPVVRWQKALGPLADFDGFSIGLGMTAHIRLGEDPDSARAILRSIRFGDIRFPAVFPAMQSWYVNNPIAAASISNSDAFSLFDVQVSFYQKGYMDAPTVCASIPELKPGESREIGVRASFNQEVFRTEGVTPVSGELIVSYKAKGRDGEQKRTVSYEIQDRTAIVWDDDRKAAAFVTPSDSALRNYASFIRQACKGLANAGYSDAVQFAAQLYLALGELGMLYQSDPISPFAATKDGKATIDSVSLPRDTLKRITGDCDDLTVLFASLLESAGYESALITVPGHIYVAVNTKLPAKDHADLSPDRSMSINVNGSLWVPIEITMIGRASFAEAWRKGVGQWIANEARPETRGFYPIAAAQEVYRPVGLRETDLGLQYGRKEAVAAAFSQESKKLVDAVVAAYAAAAKQDSKEDLNRLGVRYARFGYADKAVDALKKSATLDSSYLPPRINLGNAYYIAKQFDKALAEFAAVEKRLETETLGFSRDQGAAPDAARLRRLAGVRENIARSLTSLGRDAQAKEWLAKAAEADPASSARSARVAAAAADSGEKAAEAADELYYAE